jgi:PAS domain S-box-containing protein
MSTPDGTAPASAATDWGPAAQAMFRAAQAVAQPGGPALFEHLVAELAALLPAATVFVATFADPQHTTLRTLAATLDGRPLRNFDYPLAGSPCEQVVGHGFRYVARGVAAEFRPGTIFGAKGMDGYAAFPLDDREGRPLGLLVAMDRAPIADAALAEALLKIFAGRIVAEIERSAADEALRRSEASHRAIFAAAEDAIFVHDWNTFEVLDVNPKACATYGYTYEELRRIPVAQISSGEPPYTEAQALAWLTLAKGGPCPPFEWHRRNKDGSLHWDEVRLKPALIGGRPHILAFTREITERKLALEALRRSEEQYRAIFAASADALILWDSGLRRVDVNPAYERMFGWSRDEVLGRGYDRPDDGDAYAKPRHDLVRRALSGETCRAELVSRRKDGSVFPVEVHATPFQHNGERHVLAIARDVTERRAALEALEAREEQYRAIFETSSDGFVLWDRHLTVVDANPAALRLYGYTREQVVGAGYPAGLPGAYVQERLDLVRRALAGETVQVETTALRARGDHSAFDIDLRVMPFRHRGEPHVLAVVRDISERRERERALRRSEARLRATVEAAFDCVIGMDGKGRIVEWNVAAERCFGHRREDVLGRSLAETILPHRHRDAHTRGLLHFHTSRRGPMVGRLVETTALRADGSEIPVELAISVAEVPEGSIFVGHLRDISARRAAEAERAALEAQLRQAQKMEAIGQLTGGIAHDFNNILTSVIGYLVLGEERARKIGDANLVRQLGAAQLAAQRAKELTAQMLAFARRQRSERRALALAPLVEQALKLLRSTLPASLRIDATGVDADVPAVQADAVQLEQVLFNLCINARDAMDGSGRIRVHLCEAGRGAWRCASCGGVPTAGRWVEIGVADTGGGITPEVAARMFEPFYSTKEVGRGSGMGLAMVHGIVHEHGGHVVVETAPGRGSLFRVLLPAAAGAALAPPAALPAPAEDATALRGRVLLVEDDAMVADFMAELLAGWGLDVVLLRDPLAAAAWIDEAANRVDLLVTDQTMPALTGLALAARARATRPALPVLLVTGNADPIDAATLHLHGVAALVRKPVEPARLRDRLRALLGA